jgi:hypothetical protein
MDKVLAFAMFITLDGETILHRQLVDKKLIEMYYEAQKKND